MTHIVYGIDNKYLPPMIVSLYTVLKTATEPVNITVFTVGSIDNSNIEKLIDYFPSATLKVRQFNIDSLKRYEQTETAKQYPPASMVPIFIPWLVDTKCLFLDADTLILKDVSKLFQTDLNDSHIAAVLDYSSHKSVFRGLTMDSFIKQRKYRYDRTNILERARKLGFTATEYETEYFNSGVILFDVSEIKMFDPSGERMKNLKDGLELWSRLPDQDILNVYFRNRVKYLNIKWNIQKDILGRRGYLPTDFNSRLITATRDPAILHFLGIFTKNYWEKDRRQLRRRHRIYRRVCVEIKSRTGIDVIQMFRARIQD